MSNLNVGDFKIYQVRSINHSKTTFRLGGLGILFNEVSNSKKAFCLWVPDPFNQ